MIFFSIAAAAVRSASVARGFACSAFLYDAIATGFVPGRALCVTKVVERAVRFREECRGQRVDSDGIGETLALRAVVAEGGDRPFRQIKLTQLSGIAQCHRHGGDGGAALARIERVAKDGRKSHALG
ncbi:MAG: hypothetical protein U0163_10560 [Gemmatimonadaceae bacterium]